MSVTDGHQSYQPSATLTDFALGRAEESRKESNPHGGEGGK